MRDKPAADPILNDMEYILPRVSLTKASQKGSNQNFAQQKQILPLPFKTLKTFAASIQWENHTI